MFKTLRTIHLSKKFRWHCRHYSNEENNVEVLGAVRTPFHKANNLSKVQLATQVIDEVIKRSAIPKDRIQKIHLIGLNQEDAAQICSASDQLHKKVCFETSNNVIDSLSDINGAFQNSATAEAAIICGVDCKDLTIPSINETYDFGLEIMPIFDRKRRGMVDKDATDGNEVIAVAAAIALMKPNCFTELNIRSLGSLTHTVCSAEQDTSETLQNFLKYQSHPTVDINNWELLFSNDVVARIKEELGLDSTNINRYYLHDVVQQLPSVGPLVLLTHLIHKLKSKETAYIVGKFMAESLGMIALKKNSFKETENLPKLTIYTKNCCPLCDDLIEELEQNFKNEYCLEKVFIDCKENVRFLRLYRNDIPVLFLNGYFVCMHRLNKDLLRQMLSQLVEN